MKSHVNMMLVLVLIGLSSAGVAAENSVDPFLGRWALTIPGGGAGWLGVAQEDGYIDASILWGGGSVVPLTSVYVDGDTLYLTRERPVSRRDADGEVVRVHKFAETISATLNGKDTLSLVQRRPETNGVGVSENSFTGVLIAPMPPTPDFSKIQYGDSIALFNGKNLDGWQPINPRQVNGWLADDGALVNDAEHVEGAESVNFGNLKTEGEFEDFTLSLDVSVPAEGNSGVYLRGIYEIQVSDSYGRELDSHNMGAVYSRLTPSSAAEKKAGAWQSLEMTLWKRHITIVLNGTTIIDNAPVLGCTGGAMTSNEFKAGPIYLQGDHGSVKYRNIIMRPIKN